MAKDEAIKLLRGMGEALSSMANKVPGLRTLQRTRDQEKRYKYGSELIINAVNILRKFDEALRWLRDNNKQGMAQGLKEKYDILLPEKYNMVHSWIDQVNPTLATVDDTPWPQNASEVYHAKISANNLGEALTIAAKEITEFGTKRVPWDKNNPNFILLSEAVVKFADGKIPLPTLSKRVSPDGPILHMRLGQRCRVHIGEFREYIKREYPTLDVGAEIAEEYVADIEARKSEIRHEKEK